MRRASIIGAGLVVAGVIAVTMSLGGTREVEDAASGTAPPTASASGTPSLSTGPAGSGDLDDPVEEDLPPSTSATELEAPIPTTSIPDAQSIYDPRKTGEDLPPGYRLLLRRDEIRPIYSAVFISPDKVDWPLDTLVIGVAGEIEAKAYPVIHLTSREMVNDTLDGTPILVSWCPLCGTAMVHRRTLDGTTLVFGNQGDLFGNAMTWWDHDTGSVWSQPRGEAILGPRSGTRLELLSSTLTTWGSWLESHPETVALNVADLPVPRIVYNLDQMAIVVDLGSEAAAYEVPQLRELGIVNDVVAGIEIAVVIDPNDQERWAVFSRRLDDTVVELALSDDGLVDVVSGTVFDPFVGLGRSGPLADQNLDRLPAFTIFPYRFGTFFPSESP